MGEWLHYYHSVAIQYTPSASPLSKVTKLPYGHSEQLLYTVLSVKNVVGVINRSLSHYVNAHISVTSPRLSLTNSPSYVFINDADTKHSRL